MIAKFKKNKRENPVWNILASFVLLIFALMIIFFLAKANMRTKERRAELLQRVEILQQEMESLEEIKKRLETETLSIEDDEYLEKVAREQLGLKLPGEEVVYITREEDDGEETEEQEEIMQWWQQINPWNFFR